MAGRKMPEKFPPDVVIDKLKEVVQNLRETFPVDCVYLYGSYARGRPRSYSDVDVVVISPAFGHDIVAETTKLMEFFDDAELIIEPRAYSRQEYENAVPGTFLHDQVITKGIRIA